MGIALNDDKREPGMTRTRHLGFGVDLAEKMISLTCKHSRKIVAYFNRCLMIIRKKGRLPVKDVQRMLGLQNMDKHGI